MRAFTLVELVFVIVIIGIVTVLGVSSFKPKYLIDDVNFIHAKIREAQFVGIGYEHLNFNGTGGDANMTTGCINIEKGSLEENATKENEVNYKLHVTIENKSTYKDDNIICFDAKGRPHHTDFTRGTLLDEKTIFSFTYGAQERNITIEPLSGYSRIEY